MTQPTFYITTAIAYPNGEPHMGHAYENISADMLARFYRLDGYRVHFLTGIDDHGQKMVQTAQKMGISVEELGDRMTQKFLEMNQTLLVSHDDFIRTKEERHKKAARALWRKIQESGDIYLGSYKGWYCPRQEAFCAEEETHVRDGVRYGPSGSPVEWMEEESYFFKLSAYAERLLQFYKDVPDFLCPPERLNEVVAFIENGLSDLSVSRSRLTWGIPVPGDEQHVMYVWIDALTNYISGLGYPDVESDLYQTFWPADVHIVGKDIVRFHAIIWPALLMAAGLELPKCVFGHGFLFHKGSKMSKSVGNVVSPLDLVEKYGPDGLRYFLLREIPYGQDGSYSEDMMRERLNAELSNDLGNLVQRCLTMVQKQCKGLIPSKPRLGQMEEELLQSVGAGTLQACREAMKKCELHVALRHLHTAVAQTNRYFAAQEPWKHKDNPEQLKVVFFTTMEALRMISIQLLPVMPVSCTKILDILNVPVEERMFKYIETGQCPAHTFIQPFSALFPRIIQEVSAP